MARATSRGASNAVFCRSRETPLSRWSSLRQSGNSRPGPCGQNCCGYGMISWLRRTRSTRVVPAGDLDLPPSLDITDPAELVRTLRIDRSVDPVTRFRGGTTEARERLRKFTRRSACAIRDRAVGARGRAGIVPVGLSPLRPNLACRDRNRRPRIRNRADEPHGRPGRAYRAARALNQFRRVRARLRSLLLPTGVGARDAR